MSLLVTTLESLRSRRRHLEADFAVWRERSESGDLKQHCSQISRIADTLTGALRTALGGTPIDLGAPVPVTAKFDDVPTLRRAVGSIYLLWEFFRGKFAQRDVEAFDKHLAAADDLAWACFLPFQQAVMTVPRAAADSLKPEAIKEPPLVFYAEDRTPFAQARTKTFHPEGLDAKDLENFAAVLMHLPVPVIGIPWAVANRTPDLVLVGHEAGHVIAEDCGLALPAKTLLEGLVLAHDNDGKRKLAWVSWSDEIFADVIGVLATGTSFVAALCAELVAGVEGVRRTRIDKNAPGRYPSPTLRVALCERVLTRLGLVPSSAWAEVYDPIVGDSQEFAKDVELVADSLFDAKWAPLGDKRLVDVLPWSNESEAAAENVAAALLASAVAPVPFSPRVWVAAALNASQKDPEAYAKASLDAETAKQIVARRTDAVRSKGSTALRSQLAPADSGLESFIDPTEALRRADENRGKEIAQLLKL